VTEPVGGIDSVVLAFRKILLGGESHRRMLAKALNLGTIELAVLQHLHEVDQLTPREIGERLGITTGSTTAILDRIERAGYLIRVPNPSDRRSVFLSLTPAGKRGMDWVLSQNDAQLHQILTEHLRTATNPATDLDEVAAIINAISTAVDNPRGHLRPMPVD
jgi:DNA-binding MarR family transcriptional regulator